MLIFIKFVDKTKEPLIVDIDINSSVFLLKSKIEEEYNIDFNKQRLLYNGITLSNEYTLDKYDMRENSVVYLLYQLVAG